MTEGGHFSNWIELLRKGTTQKKIKEQQAIVLSKNHTRHKQKKNDYRGLGETRREAYSIGESGHALK